MKMSPRVVLGLVVWGVSFGVALVLSWLIVFVAFGTTFERYGTLTFVATVFSLGFLFLIWLDYLLGTKILPD